MEATYLWLNPPPGDNELKTYQREGTGDSFIIKTGKALNIQKLNMLFRYKPGFNHVNRGFTVKPAN